MAKRFADSNIWAKDWYLNLSLKQKLLVKFIYDNCDCAGIYEISYKQLEFIFGEKITKDDFMAIKQIRFIDENKIFIEDFIKFQYGVEISALNGNYSVHKGIIKNLNKINYFATLNKPLANSTIVRVQDKDKDKDKVNINKIIDPLFSKEVADFINLCKKYNFNICNTTQNRKLIAEAISNEPDMALWEEVIQKSTGKGHKINGEFKPLSLENMLKNYSKILENSYGLMSKCCAEVGYY